MPKRTKFQIRSDASKQRWVRDDKKEAFWRERIAEWKASGLSKRGYAMAHNLPESSFNAWRREIELRDREKIPTANARELLSTEPVEPKSGFIPLRIVPGGDEINKSSEKESVTSGGDETSGAIELMIPGGSVIRVTHESDFALIRRLLNVLEAKQC